MLAAYGTVGLFLLYTWVHTFVHFVHILIINGILILQKKKKNRIQGSDGDPCLPNLLNPPMGIVGFGLCTKRYGSPDFFFFFVALWEIPWSADAVYTSKDHCCSWWSPEIMHLAHVYSTAVAQMHVVHQSTEMVLLCFTTVARLGRPFERIRCGTTYVDFVYRLSRSIRHGKWGACSIGGKFIMSKKKTKNWLAVLPINHASNVVDLIKYYNSNNTLKINPINQSQST